MSRVDDTEIVAAIAAGDLNGLAAALDKYAASLYTCCFAIAPEAAAQAVQDTFTIAWSRLEGLGDPGKLGPWLHTVARNECYRALLPDSGVAQASAGIQPEVALPARLPGQVLKRCADNTPAGRAQRVTVAHRAGPFGRNGFPRTLPPPGHNWWRLAEGHPRIAAAVAAAAVTAAAATMIIAIQL